MIINLGSWLPQIPMVMAEFTDKEPQFHSGIQVQELSPATCVFRMCRKLNTVQSQEHKRWPWQFVKSIKKHYILFLYMRPYKEKSVVQTKKEGALCNYYIFVNVCVLFDS